MVPLNERNFRVAGRTTKEFEVNSDRRCPNCGEETLRTWAELGDEEREVVRRLAGSADYKAQERQSTHRWCTLCWHEETRDEGDRVV
jgi:hypothetical protein